MFRRKRFSEPAASIPWWPTEDPNRSAGNAGGHPRPGGFEPGGHRPLPAHDPFGGWPAFGDGYADGFADRGAHIDGMSGQGPPSNGWPLVEGYAGVADPFGAPAGPAFHPSAARPSAHPWNGRARTDHPANGHHCNGHPSTPHPSTQRSTADHAPSDHLANAHPVNGHPAAGHPADPYPVNARSTVDSAVALPAVHPETPQAVDTATPGADQSEGVPDWIPLLTHPIGGQRFQPDLEAAPDPADRPAAGRPPRRRNGRRPKPRRRQSGRVDDSGPDAGVTTWIPAIDALTPAQGPSADPGLAAAAQPRTSVPSPRPGPTPAPLAAPDPAEASSLAGAFAADYLSWDQDNPARRGQVLAQYLPADVTGDPTLLGWSGKGRQRSEFSLPGAVHPDGEGRVLVDVRVRVTPFRQVGPADRVAAPAPDAHLEVAGVPAVAPAPSARGWKSQDSHWVRLTVPVTRDQGRLVVDTWDEQLGEDAANGGADAGAAAEVALDPRDADDPGTADDADDAEGPTSEQDDR